MRSQDRGVRSIQRSQTYISGSGAVSLNCRMWSLQQSCEKHDMFPLSAAGFIRSYGTERLSHASTARVLWLPN